jgi:hypothetical protein
MSSDAVLLAMAFAVALAVTPLLRTPSHVDHLVVDNPTEFELDVDVAGSSGGTLGVGPVEAGDEVRFDDVLDQGDDWRILLSSAGVDAAEVRISRDDLERDGWRVTVPEEAAERLRAAGMPPTPDD